MRKAKKIVNDPRRVVPDLLEGLIAASHGRLTLVEGVTVVVRASLPREKVALLIGGGSGHEPLFPGLVGEGLADGAACGHVFAAPSPDVILAATRAVHRGKGILYLYGNYAGDNLNFDLAAEMATEEGIVTRTLRVWDDVASAPPERFEDRRGIAGDLFVIKVAGAAATVLGDLEDVYRVAARARDHTRTMGWRWPPARSRRRAARQGMEQTKQMVARVGKSKTLGERALGHTDPGAVSVYLILKTMAEYVNQSD